MDYFFNLVGLLAEGLQYTLGLFFVTILLSLPLGMLLMFAKRSRFAPLRWFIEFYVWLMRGTPLLLQLFFFYYGLALIPFVGQYLTMDRYPAALLTFALNYAAYFCEIFRGGMLAIDKGQYEAAQVLGFNRWQTFWKITLPQMLRVCLPSITNETITLVKDTALVTTVGVTEILYFAKTSVNRDVNPSAYLVAAVFYLIMNYGLTFLFKRLEKKLKF